MSSMAAADGSTCAGSSPKTQAVSMQSVGLTRFPPASMEYLIASSKLARRGSPVNRKPCRYPSKARRCDSQRSPLFNLLAMGYPAMGQPLRAAQHAPDKGGRLVAGEALRELDGLSHGHARGHVTDMEHLVEGEAQDRTLHRAHAVHRPPFRDLREQPVEGVPLRLHAAQQPHGVLLDVPPVLPPARHGRLQGPLRHGPPV